MPNNYFSNSAQNALNNMNPKNAFSGYSSFFKPPTTGASQTPAPAPKTNPVPLPNNMNSSNTIYSSNDQPIASKFPIASKNTPSVNNNGNQLGGGNTSGGSTFPVNNTQTPAPKTNPYTPQSYADQLKNAYTGLGKIQEKRGILSQAPLGQFNVGSRADDVKQYQAGLMAAESKPYEQQINASNIGLQASLPKTITAGEMAYNPLSGTNQINAENQSSSGQRLANVGGQSAITGLGSSQVGLTATQNQINHLRQQIGLNGNQTDVTVLNGIINDVVNHIGSPRLTSFRTMLGALSNAISSDNPSLSSQLSNFASGDGLANASPQVLSTAIATAQQAIQAKQQANQETINGGQGGGGNSYGGLI